MPDTAFQLFELLRKDNLAIQTGRYGAFINQAFPLAVAKMGGTLPQILISYSLAFVLFPFIIFSILQWLLQQTKLALAVVLFSCLMVVHTFFWIQSELITACLYLLLAWGFVSRKQRPGIRWNWLWLLPLLILGITTHPLALIPHLYIGLFFLLRKDTKYRSELLYFTLAGPLIVLVKWSLLSIHAYDAGAMGLSQHAFLQFYRFFEWQSTRQFLRNCLSLYPLFLPLFGWIIFYYWKNREKGKLILFAVSTLGYLILVNGTFNWGGTVFHMEAFYQVLVIFLALPLAFDLLPKLPRSWIALVLGVFIGHSFLQIVVTGKIYQQRTQWISNMMEEYRSKEYNKVLLAPGSLPMDTLLLEWGLPYETALLSGLLAHRNTFGAAINAADAPLNKWKSDRHVFLHTFGAIPYTELNELPYFNFQDTAKYVELTIENGDR